MMKKLPLMNYQDLAYCKADGSYTFVHTTSDEKFILTKRLKLIEEQLPQKAFCRCHRSYLVNINEIAYVEISTSPHIQLRNGMNIPISRRNLSRLKKQVKKFIK